MKPGDRVEIHPRYDWWMRGARYGTVVRIIERPSGKRSLAVKLDKAPGAEIRIPEEDLTLIE